MHTLAILCIFYELICVSLYLIVIIIIYSIWLLKPLLHDTLKEVVVVVDLLPSVSLKINICQTNNDQLNVLVANSDLDVAIRKNILETDVKPMPFPLFLSHTVSLHIPEQKKTPVSVNRTLMNIY